LLIYLLGVHQGDIGSAGTWYNAVGQSGKCKLPPPRARN
jgi:hypothetical protein